MSEKEVKQHMAASTVTRSIAILVFCMAPIVAGNIVINGSFEENQISGNYYQAVFAADTITIPGWTVGTSATAGVDVVQGAGWWSEEGTQGIDMAGTPGPGSLAQTLATTSGAEYLLSFWVSSNGGPWDNGLTVDWNATQLATISSPAQGTWEKFSYQVTGTGSDNLYFLDNVAGYAGPLLDNVSAQAIPEPTTFGLIGAGLLLVGRRLRRR
jgi:hypothetical protein